MITFENFKSDGIKWHSGISDGVYFLFWLFFRASSLSSQGGGVVDLKMVTLHYLGNAIFFLKFSLVNLVA